MFVIDCFTTLQLEFSQSIRDSRAIHELLSNTAFLLVLHETLSQSEESGFYHRIAVQ